jgi:hypothetical protein
VLFFELILTSRAIDFTGVTAEDRLKAEMACWTNIYSEYASGIRIVTLNKKPALLLPHFDHPSKRGDVLQAIEKTLRQTLRPEAGTTVMCGGGTSEFDEVRTECVQLFLIWSLSSV